MNAIEEKLIPYISELKDAVENSRDGWHQKESVFDHTLSVFSALQEIIAENKNLAFLNEKIEKHTRKEILEVATILHDIGKKEAMIVDNGFTSCKGHEEISVRKAKIILEKFDFTEKEKEKILKIVANHTEFHILLTQRVDLSKFGEIKFNLPDIWQDLLLLGYADTKNSKLKEVNLKEFEYRINFYKKEISLW